MAEYIERKAVHDLIRAAKKYYWHNTWTCEHRSTVDADDLHFNVDKVPTAEVAPVVHGRWVYDHWCEFKCSECGHFSESKPYKGREPYCPNCGAKMDLN